MEFVGCRSATVRYAASFVTAYNRSILGMVVLFWKRYVMLETRSNAVLGMYNIRHM